MANREKRTGPAGNGTGLESLGDIADSTAPTGIAYVGATERANGWQLAVEQFIADSNEIARAAGPLWRHPRQAETDARRVVDHQPCRTKCDRCSRCLHSRAWYARGQRPFLGVEAEATLAGGAI